MDSLNSLVKELEKLPSIGNKTATRIAYHIMKSDIKLAKALSENILNVKTKLLYCGNCYNISSLDPCNICLDETRDHNVVCVVEEPFNINPIEKTGEYNGLYHVLLGRLAPQRGIGPDRLKIKELLQRLDGKEEIIIATNPNVEGEATALYLSRLLTKHDLKVTRLAFGLPIGGDLEYVDEVTLGRSISGRRAF